jgi:hypothetical protein
MACRRRRSTCLRRFSLLARMRSKLSSRDLGMLEELVRSIRSVGCRALSLVQTYFSDSLDKVQR